MNKIIQIQSILGGWGVSDYFMGGSQFLSSIGIDPDYPADDDGNKPSGLIRPVATAKFSGTEITGVPLWLITNPKDSNIYCYANDGKVHVVTSALAMGTALNSGAAISGYAGNGAEYYDNYLYLAGNTLLGRYGPLNGSPALDTDYWNGDLSLTALTDTTYPSINGVEIPNHQMHRHTDGKLYICDVLASNKGALHYLKTTKTTVEGDTNDGSTHAALDFDYGEYPVCIETYQTDLVVALIEGVNTTTRQKPARLSFWDTTSDSFSSITSVELADPIITAIKNINGVLYIFSGNAGKGCRISRLVSGYSIEEIAWLPEQYPPISKGAIDHLINRYVFGSNTVEPEVSGSVFAIGGRERNFPMGIHNVLRATGAGANPWVTCIKFVTQTSGTINPIIIGFDDDTNRGLDKLSTTYSDQNVWRSDVFVVGKKFQINKIIVPFAQAIAANMTLTIKVYGDDGTTTPSADTDTLITVNNTKFPNGERQIEFHPKVEFNNNIFLQLEWSGSALLTVALPITIELFITEN